MKQIITYLTCFLILSCQTKNSKGEKKELTPHGLIKTEYTIKGNQLDTLLNTDNYLIIGDKIAKVKIINKNEIDKFPTYQILIGYRDDLIIGERIEYDTIKIYKKYIPKTSFEDFPAQLYKGKLAEPDFSSYPDAKRFITRIKKECANGINFAGHYTLVTWGCGSSCQNGVIVDRKTGKIFGRYGTALGSEFKKNSKMIIRNVGAIDTTTNLIEVCTYCEVNHEIWNGTEFIEAE